MSKLSAKKGLHKEERAWIRIERYILNGIESDSTGLLGSSFSLKFLELIDSWIRRFAREDRRLWKESYTSKTLFELRYERHKM